MMRVLFDECVEHLRKISAIPETTGLITCPDDPSQIIPKLLDLGVSETILYRALNGVFGWPVYSTEAHGDLVYADPDQQWGYADGILFLACPFDTSMQPGALLPDKACREVEGIGLLPRAGERTSTYDRAFAERVIRGWLERAAGHNATDLHIMPLTSNYVRVRMRVDGQLRTLDEFPMSGKETSYRYISNMLLKMMDRQTGNFTKPMDGRFECEVDGSSLEVRVAMRPVSVQNTASQAFFLRLLMQGESAAFRTLESLGLPEWASAFFAGLRRLSQGLILMTGPTGSGKSSTLYANLARIARDDPWRSIQTLEDPIEQSIEGIMQTQINADIGMGFHEGLRALMRSDVDVILVGEVRDEKTARLVVRAGLTGHLVFATLHANTALLAVERMFDLGIGGQPLSSVLSAVVSQRLLRRVCPVCAAATCFAEHPDRARYDDLLRADDEVAIANPAGCAQCDGGYKGRVLAVEAVRVDRVLAEAIGSEVASGKLTGFMRLNEYPTLWEASAALVKQGLTTLEECERHLPMRERRTPRVERGSQQLIFPEHYSQEGGRHETTFQRRETLPRVAEGS